MLSMFFSALILYRYFYLYIFLLGAHRRRSNTAQRLDMLRRDKQAKGKIKTISWKDAPVSLTGNVFQ